MSTNHTIGIIGGSGTLGRAMSEAFLSKKFVNQENFWVSNRTGHRQGFSTWPDIKFTNDYQVLNDACNVIILCVPPHQFKTLSLNCEGKLVISVMAGVSLSQLQNATRSNRAVRAMSSPAAEFSLAYSPWIVSKAALQEDRDLVYQLFKACGETDELHDESQIELFTAMTGPIPGFVAYFADCISNFATDKGVSPEVANRAVKQLFLAAGTLMAKSDSTAQEDVQDMINYNGTTAAGLINMQKSSLREDVSAGLQAAVNKTRQMV